MPTEAIPLHRPRILPPAAAKPVHVPGDGAAVRETAPQQAIVIIDRRTLVRDCLVSAFQTIKKDRRIEYFSTVAELLQQDWRRLAPSLLVYCYHDTGGNPEGLEEDLSALSGAPQQVPFVLVSDVDDIDIIDRAFQMGMCGFIPSSLSLQVVIQAVEIVEAGGTYLPAEFLLGLRRGPSHPRGNLAAVTETLTPRQRDVLRELRKGKANKVIALDLAMRESTVKVHVRNIMRKLNARNRTEVTFMTNGIALASEDAPRPRGA